MANSFRPDIQGLRAIAILLVILYHSNVPFTPGGFIGVDIFFVISGFLITRLILQDLQQNQFSLTNFYSRRIRRIFPALFLMLACVSAMAIWRLPPAALNEYAKTMLAASAFVSNIQFLYFNGYFDSQANLKPLLHTWSLAVEEQFYLLFPLFLLACWKFARQRLSLAITTLALASFALSLWAVNRNPAAAFYSSPTRAYELMFGALIAIGVFPIVKSKYLSEALTLAGFALIALSAIAFNTGTPFPGSNALIPCLGAALIIHCGATHNTAIAKLLSLTPLTFLGGISYALYLWHWPALVFARWQYLTAAPAAAICLALSIAFFMAFASTYLLEKPILATSVARKPLFLTAASATAVFACFAITLVIANGLPNRFTPEAQRFFNDAHDFNPLRTGCQASNRTIIPYEKTCVYGSPGVEPATAIWGDSFGAELAEAAGELAVQRAQAIRQLTSSACPPTLGFKTRYNPPCAERNQQLFDGLRRDSRIKTVVMIANYESYASYSDSQELFAGFERAAEGLTNVGKHVVIVYPIPTFPMSVPYALGLLSERGRTPQNYALLRADYDRLNAPAIRALDIITLQLGADRLLPAQAFCDSAECKATFSGSSAYFDQEHLSLHGARLLLKLPGVANLFFPNLRSSHSSAAQFLACYPHLWPILPR